MQQAKMMINAASVESNNTVDVMNPATGEAFAKCHFGAKQHVDEAVQAARAAFPAWSALSDGERQQYLMKLADLLESNMPEIMGLITNENGKPFGGLEGIGSGMEVGGAIAWIQYNAGVPLPEPEVIQDNDEARIEVHRKPLGVVASITPWNWPLMIAIWHTIPALRMGNTVIIKPSPNTPVATTRFVELANTVLPPGVFNIVHGDVEVGSAISEHQGIDKIIFTGSTGTGKRIMQSASDNLKRLTLELGGNDAGIVLPGIDVEKFAPRIFLSGFHNNGQTCAALKRLYVHESQYEEMCAALAKIAENTVVGDGKEESTQLGPLQNKEQLDVVMSLAEDARNNGGRFLSGGERMSGNGYFYRPTIVADQTDGNRLVDEEQFGPILPVIKYSDVDEVVKRANQNQNGLGGSVWSEDIAKATEIAQRLECGSVWINEHGNVQPDAPFGGVKQSGIGVEFGLRGLAEYTSIQTVKIPK